ncbi:MAG: hypothetical protein B6244_05210 [Candidatus Cloacimonetes bacterium 4572_55]|nr:MAG: hypothetical protein B6244_05210 [Candidatus Cloacimonetes bacterium 4572_55]
MLEEKINQNSGDANLQPYLELAEQQLADHLRAVSSLKNKRKPKSRKVSQNPAVFDGEKYLIIGGLFVFGLFSYFWIVVSFFDDSNRTHYPTQTPLPQLFLNDEAWGKERQPDHSQALFSYNRGMDFLKSRQYRDAARMFETARDHDPRFLGSYINAAYAHLQEGQVDRATENLRRAQRLDPNHPRLLLMLGICYGIRGDVDWAIFYLDRVIRLASDTEFAETADRLLADLTEGESFQ